VVVKGRHVGNSRRNPSHPEGHLQFP
jgi:hypothetical protein